MKEWLIDFAVAFICAALILCFIKPTIVRETSMEPTLEDGDYLFLSKQAYNLFGEPERGDIIVFDTDLPREDGRGNKLLIKRIIGLPGDTVDIENGCVYVNGSLIYEEYIGDNITMARDAGNHFEVPEGDLFCMGDHRDVSLDSRWISVGYVSLDDVVGKAVFRLYPFSEIGRI